MREKLFDLLLHFVYLHFKGKIEINFDGSGEWEHVTWNVLNTGSPSKEIFYVRK